MLPGFFFISFRLLELCFLIPILGILASIVHGYVSLNELSPSFVLVLFIVVVIASFWALLTMLFYGITKHNAYFVAFIDLCIFGGLIGGVAVLGPVNHITCSNQSSAIGNVIYYESGPYLNQFSHYCSLLKACFGLGIVSVILFFFTVLILLWVHHHHRNDYDHGNRTTTEKSYRHHSSRNDRRRSRSRPRNGGSSNGDGYDYERGNSRRRSQSRGNYGP